MIYILTGIVSAIFFFIMFRNAFGDWLYKKWFRSTLDIGVTAVTFMLLIDSAGGPLMSLTCGATYTMLNGYYFKTL